MAQAFNEAELMERVDNDVGFLAETVEMLTSDGRSLMADIGAAAAAGDAGAVGRAAHSLKGMISNFCAPAAHAAALEVERLGKSGDVSGAGSAIQTLSSRLDDLIAELGVFLQARA